MPFRISDAAFVIILVSSVGSASTQEPELRYISLSSRKPGVLMNTVIDDERLPSFRSRSAAMAACELTASRMTLKSEVVFAMVRLCMICCLASGSFSSSMHGMPLSSMMVRSVTTEVRRLMREGSDFARSSAV